MTQSDQSGSRVRLDMEASALPHLPDPMAEILETDKRLAKALEEIAEYLRVITWHMGER